MRVFITGATGWVGFAVVQELLAAGHEVLGLARSDASASALAAIGAEVHRGELEDIEGLRRGAARVDAVIHTAFIHDFSKFAENCEVDRRAIMALGAELDGSDRPLIVTSGTGLLPGEAVTEDTEPRPPTPQLPRVSEQAALAAAEAGLRVAVIRLPPSVHGAGDHGFVPTLIEIARQQRASAYVGAGENRWPSVHRLDAARLYRLVLERGRAGARYHAVADTGVRFRDIAEVIGRRLDVPVVSKSEAEAATHFGWFTHFAKMGNLASSERTRAELGWEPVEPTLLGDLDSAAYFPGSA